MKGKTSKIIRLAASICLIIGGAIFLWYAIVWHSAWGEGLANFCVSMGAILLFFTLQKKEKKVRGDERTRMISERSSRNAFFAMLSALSLAIYVTTKDIQLFAFVIIVIGILVFAISAVYYNRAALP